MSICYDGIVIPPKEQEPCNGKYTSTDCVIHQASIPSLDLPANSSMTEVIEALKLAILFKEEQIQSLLSTVESLQEQINELNS